jgi:CubicO group peptidase (beta-lactamase class C family)
MRTRSTLDRSRRPRGPRLAVASLLAVAALATGCASPLVGLLPDGGVSAPPSAPVREGPAPGQAADPGCEQPTADGEFERVDPARVDLDAEAVADAILYATAKGAQSVRVYRHDCLVGTSGWDPSTEWSLLPAWSMTKGVVSVVVGRAVALGLMDVDAPIGRYLAGLDEPHAAITVRQLLTQTSGLRFAWANDLNAAATLDSARLVLTRPFEAEPGTTFIYAQTTVTALVSVVEAAVGEDFQAFADREVFRPIGIERREWSWDRDIVGTTQGFAFLSMTPKAFARLGSLLGDGGRWRGTALLDAEYIRQGATGTLANPGYGFLWRTNHGPDGVPGPLEDPDLVSMSAAPEDTFYLSGLFEQNVVMIPSLDLVVVRMGLPDTIFPDPMGMVKGRQPDWDHRFFRTLLAGVTDVELTDPGEWVPPPERPPEGLEPEHLIGIGF